MANETILVTGRQTNDTIGVNTTRYYACGSAMFLNDSLEIDVQVTYHHAGTASNMFLKMVANAHNNPDTFRMRINGADGNLVIVTTAATPGDYEDNSNTDSISDGDEVNYKVVTGPGSGNPGPGMLAVVFTPTSGGAFQRLIATGATTMVANNTRYDFLTGLLSSTALEVDSQYQVNGAGIFQNGFVYASTARTTNSLCQFRVDTADGNILVTVTASTPGVYEDTSNTDTVAADQVVNWKSTTPGGSGTLTRKVLSVEHVSTDGYYHNIFQFDGGSHASNAGTKYTPITGEWVSAQATENKTDVEVQVGATASNLQIYLTSNSLNNTLTLNFRINGAGGNLTVPVTSSTTGFLEDTSNSDTLVATDNVNTQLVEVATSGNSAPSMIGVQFKAPGGAPVAGVNIVPTLLFMGVG